MSLPIEFDLSTLADGDLRSICKWTVQQRDRWPALSCWLVDFVGGEALRRLENPDEFAPQYIQTPFHSWSDSDVGEALLGVTMLSYAEGIGAAAAALVDKLVVHIVGESRRRLLSRDLARCN